MSIKLLRWTSGMAGDTVLKILLDSNPHLQSQNRYLSLNQGRTQIDYHFCKSFPYDQIAQMSLMDASTVDQNTLFDQLTQLEQSHVSVEWLLKTHCYFDFLYPVIDLTVPQQLMPFVVKAGLYKNSREKNFVPNYHVLTSKISDAEILYKFDCFNYAQDLLHPKKHSDQQISLINILGGFDNFKHACSQVNLFVSDSCKNYYNQWFEQNQKFMPSTKFVDLVQSNNFDYTLNDLSIEERYCLLAISGKKFKVLQ